MLIFPLLSQSIFAFVMAYFSIASPSWPWPTAQLAGWTCLILALLGIAFLQSIGNYRGIISSSVFESESGTPPSPARDQYLSIGSAGNFSAEELQGLEMFLNRASLSFRDERTVLLAPVNSAWAVPGGLLDMFLESFRLGDGTEQLLDHLAVIAMDKAALNRCLEVHSHCFELQTVGVDFSGEQLYMAKDYIKMNKRRLYFQKIVLELGFNFIFSDLDILWFRPPFQHFSKDADLEVACDRFNGNSSDSRNSPNMGFVHARSNPRTIRLFEYWVQQNEAHPEIHEQNVFNLMRNSSEFAASGARVKYMPTLYFGGFCQKSPDLEKVCTMHANCCVGNARKLEDLRTTLEDWKLFKSMTPQESRERGLHFRAPQKCL